MKKALELLKTYINKNIGLCAVPQYVKDSIAELEEVQLTRREWYQKGYAEAMKPKTCEGCAYEAKDGVICVECAFCLRNSNDNFKPKDTQY